MEFISRKQMIILMCKPLYTQHPHFFFLSLVSPFKMSGIVYNHHDRVVEIKCVFIHTLTTTCLRHIKNNCLLCRPKRSAVTLGEMRTM